MNGDHGFWFLRQNREETLNRNVASSRIRLDEDRSQIIFNDRHYCRNKRIASNDHPIAIMQATLLFPSSQHEDQSIQPTVDADDFAHSTIISEGLLENGELIAKYIPTARYDSRSRCSQVRLVGGVLDR